MNEKFWHPTAFSSWGPEEHEAMTRVIASNRFTQGAEVEAFEAEFAAYHDRTYAIMVNSGSSANLVATAALFHVKQDRPLRRGDKAVVPAIAWSTTYAPLVQHGLDLILVDVDGSWNADLMTPRFDPQDANLIVGASILGSPAQLDALSNAASTLGAFFIEDNCESLGARTDGGNLCGTFGDLSTFSLFWSHQLGAIEGGVILTDDEELAMLCRMLRAHGWTRDVTVGGGPFEEEYDFRLMGYNVRGLELHAAIAREQLKKLDAGTAARRWNLDEFHRLTADLPITHQEFQGEPSQFGLAFAVQTPSARDGLVASLRLAGIDCRLPTGGSLRLHAYGAPWASQETPLADIVHRTGLFLGNPPTKEPEAMARIAEVIKGAL